MEITSAKAEYVKLRRTVMSFNIQMPSRNLPVFIIGAGGIVNDAHLPAYKIAGFPVAGIFDVDSSKAMAAAEKFKIPLVFATLDEMLNYQTTNPVYDIAVPAPALMATLEKLPAGANVLMQKPMGQNLAEAKQVLQITREKKMIAGVNFQLRYAPFITEARDMLEKGLLGELVDIEINVNVYTPWYLWDFLYSSPRVEILYHSIHYIDLVRSFLGEPQTVYAKTIRHPAMKELASVRSNIIMDYGEMVRANILTNHCHVYGTSHQESYIKLEGTAGAIKIGFGLLKNYPVGEPDKFEYITVENGVYKQWRSKKIEGSWFPHAFIGSMAQVMLAAEGSIALPGNSVEDSIHTMACVEAAYLSSENGGVRPGSV